MEESEERLEAEQKARQEKQEYVYDEVNDSQGPIKPDEQQEGTNGLAGKEEKPYGGAVEELYDRFVEKYENKDYLNNEQGVADFMAKVAEDPDDYEIEVYQRRALGKGERTETYTHSLYVITDKNTGVSTTCSFNTTLLLKSTGAWVTNSEMDVDSYEKYKAGSNTYDMVRYDSGNVDVKATAESVMNSIGSNTTYNAFDHMYNFKGAENCNTAVYNTLQYKKNKMQTKR